MNIVKNSNKSKLITYYSGFYNPFGHHKYVISIAVANNKFVWVGIGKDMMNLEF